jgi:Protein of unknown function (DUF2934)
MGQKSEGKPRTPNRAKTASTMRTQTQAQPLQDPSIRSRSRNWKATSATPDKRDEMDSQATGSPEGPDQARYEYDPQSQGQIEPEIGGREDFSVQEEMDEDRQRCIAERAFLLYAEGGFQHGHDLDHWLEAERDIMES